MRNPNGLWVIGMLLVMAGCGTTVTAPVPKSAPKPVQAQQKSEALTKEQQAWMTDARKAHDAGHVEAAASALGKLVAARPNLSYAQVDYALVLQKLGRTDDAIAAYRKALTLNPGAPTASNNLALLLRQQGHFKMAHQLLQRAVSLHPDNPSLRYNLAVLCELYLMDLPDALEQYQAYQKLLPQPDPKVAGWIADLKRRTR
ncbi:tetratricopeptide repeat protein [Mangrovitalea sediminis]|uniref:tetratricopeptide repeat protein n=1 Tax=Mangrovitalea sediminis TaxID=1982043 RepID=UPI0013043FA1|nr:tetratricopeptide repeat protein [Mangrovitalea sediminis]